MSTADMKITTVKVLSAKKEVASHTIQQGEVLVLQAQDKVNYQLINDATGRGPQNILAKRDGKNLVITLDEGNTDPDIIIENYYADDNVNSMIVGLHENGNIYAYVPESGEVADAVSMLAEEMVKPQALGGEELSSFLWAFNPWWLVGAAAVIGGVAIAAGGGSGGSNETSTPNPEKTSNPTVSVSHKDTDGDGVDDKTVISGKTEPNAKVDIDTNGDGTPDISTTADGNGDYSVEVPVIPTGTTVGVTATAPNKTASDKATETTPEVDTTPNPEKTSNPTVSVSHKDTDGDGVDDKTVISGKTEPNAKVDIDTNGDGTPDITTTADGNGDYSVEVPVIPTGTTVGVTATAPNKTASDKATETTPEVDTTPNPEKTSNPTVSVSHKDTDGDGVDDKTVISGKTEPNAKVDIDTNGDGTPDITTTADGNGDYSVEVPVIPTGTTVGVTATAPGKTQSDKVTETTPEVDTTPNPEKTETPSVSVSHKDTDGDGVDDKTVISGKTEPNAKVDIDTNGDGTPDITTTADGNGDYSVEVPVIPTGTTVGVTATAPNKTPSDKATETTPEVDTTPNPQKTETPSVSVSHKDTDNDGVDDKTVISGKTEPNAKVDIDTNGDGTPDTTTTADGNGDYSVEVPVIPTGTTVGVTATAPNKTPSDKATETTPEVDTTPNPEKTSNPTVSVSHKDTDGDGVDDKSVISGKTEPNATVDIDTNNDGVPDITTTADGNGDYSVEVPALEDGTKVEVTATAPNKTPSDKGNAVTSGLDKTPNQPQDSTIPGDSNNNGTIDDNDDSTNNVTIPTTGGDSITTPKNTDGKPNIIFIEDTNKDGTLNGKEVGTNNSTPIAITIPDNTKAGDKVVVTINGESKEIPLTQEDIDKGYVITDVPTTGKDKIEVTAKVVDTAGNESGTGTGSVLVDSTPEKTSNPTVSVSHKDTDGDGVDDKSVISGKTEPNATVDIDTNNDGVPDITTTADGNGDYSVEVPALEDGTKVEVTATAPNKTPSDKGNAVTSGLDKTPNQPQDSTIPGDSNNNGTIDDNDDSTNNVTIPTTGGDSITTPKNTDGKPNIIFIEDTNKDGTLNGKEVGTNNSTPIAITIPDNTKAGDKVVVTINGESKEIPLTQEDIDKGYVITDVPTTGKDKIEVTAKVVDTAGNESGTGTGSVLVDTTPEKTETPSVSVSHKDTDNDGVDDKTVISGKTEPNAKVDIDTNGDGTPDTTTTADGNGDYSVEVPALEDGTKVEVTATAPNKTPSDKGNAVTSGLDKTPNQPQDSTIPGDSNNNGTIDDNDDSTNNVTIPTTGNDSITTPKNTDGKPNIIFIEDTNKDGTLNGKEVGTNNSTPIAITIPDNTKAGDKVVVTINGESKEIPLTQEDIDKGYVITDVPTTGKDKIEVTAKVVDTAGNESGTGTGSVLVDTTPEKTETPSVSVSHKDTDNDGVDDKTVISGKTEPNAKVDIDTNGDGTPDTTTTADGNGDYSVEVPALEDGTKVEVTATAPNKTPSDKGNAVTSGLDKTPNQPQDSTIPGDSNNNGTIDDNDDSTNNVTIPTTGNDSITTPKNTDGKPNIIFIEDTNKDGTLNGKEVGTNNSTPVAITIPDNTKAGDKVVVTINGESKEIPLTQEDIDRGYVITEVPTTGKDKIEVTAKVVDTAGNESGTGTGSVLLNTSIPDDSDNNDTVPDTTAPSITLDPVKAGDTKVTGTTEPNTEVTVTLPNGTTTTVTSGTDGKFEAPLPVPAKENDTVSVTAKDKSNNVSDPVTSTVPDTTAPAITLDPVKAGDTKVTGTTEPNTEVTVTLPNGTTTTVTSGTDGKFEAPLPVPAKENDTVSVTAKDKSNNVSDPVTSTVPDTTAPAITLDPVKAGDTKVTGTTEPNTEVTVTLPNGNTTTVTSGTDGKFEAPLPVPAKENDTVSVTAKDKSNNVSDPVTSTVPDTTAPAITLDPVKAGDTKVTGTTEPNTEVTVTLPNGNTTTVTSGTDGKFEAPLPVPAKENDTVSVTAKDKSNNVSDPVTSTVPDTTAPAITLDPVKAGDTKVTGTTEPNTEVTVTLPNGNTTTVTSGTDGKFEAPLPVPAKENDTVSVTAKDKSNNVSDPVTSTVPDTTAPAITLDPVKAGDTKVTGTTEPNTEVTVTLPNGNTTTVTSGTDGKFEAPLPVPAKENDTVSVTAKDKSNNVSNPVTSTVPLTPADPVNLDPKEDGSVEIIPGANNAKLVVTYYDETGSVKGVEGMKGKTHTFNETTADDGSVPVTVTVGDNKQVTVTLVKQGNTWVAEGTNSLPTGFSMNGGNIKIHHDSIMGDTAISVVASTANGGESRDNDTAKIDAATADANIYFRQFGEMNNSIQDGLKNYANQVGLGRDALASGALTVDSGMPDSKTHKAYVLEYEGGAKYYVMQNDIWYQADSSFKSTGQQANNSDVFMGYHDTMIFKDGVFGALPVGSTVKLWSVDTDKGGNWQLQDAWKVPEKSVDYTDITRITSINPQAGGYITGSDLHTDINNANRGTISGIHRIGTNFEGSASGYMNPIPVITQDPVANRATVITGTSTPGTRVYINTPDPRDMTYSPYRKITDSAVTGDDGRYTIQLSMPYDRGRANQYSKVYGDGSVTWSEPGSVAGTSTARDEFVYSGASNGYLFTGGHIGNLESRTAVNFKSAQFIMDKTKDNVVVVGKSLALDDRSAGLKNAGYDKMIIETGDHNDFILIGGSNNNVQVVRDLSSATGKFDLVAAGNVPTGMTNQVGHLNDPYYTSSTSSNTAMTNPTTDGGVILRGVLNMGGGNDTLLVEGMSATNRYSIEKSTIDMGAGDDRVVVYNGSGSNMGVISESTVNLGAGDDYISFSGLNSSSVAGGAGLDTVDFKGTSLAYNTLSSIETVKLSGGSLSLSGANLTNLDGNTLFVQGRGSVSGVGGASTGTKVVDDVSYKVYTNGTAEILIQDGISVM